MNIFQVNESDISGGAARAAYRIQRSLVDHGEAHGLQSQMRVIRRLSDDSTVIGGPPPLAQNPIWRRLQLRLSRRARQGFHTGNPTLHSIAWPRTGLGLELQQRHRKGETDLVHLHWLGDATLSIEEIGRLHMPLVWTLHDQWAFCGAEHYSSLPLPGESASNDERYAEGYSPATRPSHEAGPDLNRRTWLRKRRAWQRPIQIICPSNWMSDCARRSALMADWPPEKVSRLVKSLHIAEPRGTGAWSKIMPPLATNEAERDDLAAFLRQYAGTGLRAASGAD